LLPASSKELLGKESLSNHPPPPPVHFCAQFNIFLDIILKRGNNKTEQQQKTEANLGPDYYCCVLLLANQLIDIFAVSYKKRQCNSLNGFSD
jgi:hypothetical protein